MRLTLRTLLAYLDDTLEAGEARDLGLRVAKSDFARDLIDRIKKATRRRGLATPATGPDDVSDPNTVAEYLSDTLPAEQVARVEENCLNSDAHLAEVAACHQILTLVLTEPVRVPPSAHQRMYLMVTGKASIPARRPGRTVPVGGAMPVTQAPDADDPDAPLLLGMRRYTSGGSAGGRALQLALVVGLAACLVVAVWLAMPKETVPPPASVRGPAYALAPLPAAKPAPLPPKDADPVKPPAPDANPPKPVDPPVAPPPAPKDADPPAPAVPPAALPPRDERRSVGRLEAQTPEAVVAVRPAGGEAFVRIMPDAPAVPSADPVVCLPGYKGKVRLESGVLVDLWATVPEVLPAEVLETRVRFHVPGVGFDGDLSLASGRVFLTSRKPGGALVRVRVAGEVWDVTLPDADAETLVEVVPSFDPGTAVLKEGGETPRVTATLVAVRGKVGLSVPRFKDFGLIAGPKAFRWENRGGPPAEMTGPVSPYFSRFPTLPPDPAGGRQALVLGMQGALADFAARVTARDSLKNRIFERLTEEGDLSNLRRAMEVKLAAYAVAALDEPRGLIDALGSENKPFARDAACTALERWLPQSPDNTVRLRKELVQKQYTEEQADAIVRLARRSRSDDLRTPAALDGLVELLASNGPVAVRELAFWTLYRDVDPSALSVPRLRFDAGGRPADREAGVSAWRQRVAEIKRKNAEGGTK